MGELVDMSLSVSPTVSLTVSLAVPLTGGAHQKRADTRRGAMRRAERVCPAAITVSSGRWEGRRCATDQFDTVSLDGGAVA